jgi:hypothetical protein
MNMKTPLNDNQPSADWIEQAVQAHLAAKPPVPQPTSEFLARCRIAGLGALDVLKMQRHRPQFANAPGSLKEHLDNVARSAGVKLEAVVETLGIMRGNASDTINTRGLAQLGQYLGLACDEVVLRVRWGMAQTAGIVASVAWPGVPVHVRRRAGSSCKSQTSHSVTDALHVCEKNYSPVLRAELRDALNAVAEVYDRDAR